MGFAIATRWDDFGRRDDGEQGRPCICRVDNPSRGFGVIVIVGIEVTLLLRKPSYQSSCLLSTSSIHIREWYHTYRGFRIVVVIIIIIFNDGLFALDFGVSGRVVVVRWSRRCCRRGGRRRGRPTVGERVEGRDLTADHLLFLQLFLLVLNDLELSPLEGGESHARFESIKTLSIFTGYGIPHGISTETSDPQDIQGLVPSS